MSNFHTFWGDYGLEIIISKMGGGAGEKDWVESFTFLEITVVEGVGCVVATRLHSKCY